MAPNDTPPSTYETSGVASLEGRRGFLSLLSQLKETFAFRPGTGRSLLDFGGYASILDIGGPQALAISTDGVGTKAVVAQLMDKYDTVGIDCVAMNANDVLCVGAEPIAMLDYIAVEAAEDRLLEEIGKGLLEGARQANISIPGGEISQIREIIRSERPGYGFDLAGTCVGLVGADAIIAGANAAPGDVIVGLASTGVHSNGLTLARDVLLGRAGLRLDEPLPEFGRTVGEELLEPTRIYVRPVLEMLRESLGITALCHVTGEGFLNLNRVGAEVGFEIDSLPDPPAIFRVIQEAGPVDVEEMYRVYNMGVGFCVVCRPESAARVREIASAAGCDSWEIGRCIPDVRRRVYLRQHSLVGEAGRFQRS
jgi:phosphoribosylformylglycinamidine cyclo-ligase